MAVVTGSASGLGQEFACRLAADGAEVVLADVADAGETVARIREETGREALAVACDLTSPEDVAALARAVTERHAGCDILVNNAGISPNVAWDDLDFDGWRRVIAVNLDSMFLTCKALTGPMRERGWGRVVNVSSNTLGLVIPGFAHYVASKGGVLGFTRALATDLGTDGVTVNCVLPGLTKTATTERMWAGTTLFEDMAQQQAIKRPGVPTDLAGVVSFLASEGAGFVTGQSIVVDGGLVRH